MQVTKQSLEKYILVCVSEQVIAAPFLQDIKNLFNESKFINQLPHSFELKTTVGKNIDLKDLRRRLMELSYKNQIDFVLMKEETFTTQKRLIVFDMDSTLIQAEVVDEIAKQHGIGEKVSLITERAMNGELNFDQSLKERVALLRGFPREKMEQICEKIELTPGVEKFVQTVQKLGYKTAIISGGFHYFAESFRKKLSLDYAFANDLEFDGHFLSGKLKGPLINAEAKANILEQLAKQEKIHLEQVAAIGDGANDLLMLKRAGMGIAFHAKEKLRLEIDHQVNFGPMTTVLNFLGIAGDHLNEAL